MKKFLLIAFFLLTPFAAHASTQVISGSMGLNNNTAQSWSTYISNATGIARAGSLPNISTLVSAAGTFSGLVATSSDPLVSTATLTVSFYKNGTQQALTCTLSAASGNCSDSNGAHGFAVVAGDNIQASIVPANTPNANLTVSYSMNFVPTTDNESIFPGGNDAAAPSTTVTNYANIAYSRPPWAATEGSTTSSTNQLIWPDAGTISNFYYNNNATLAGSGKTITLTLMNNMVATLISAVVDNTGTPSPGKANDTTHTATVAQGNLLDLQSVPSGTPSTQTHGKGFKYVSNTNGNFVTAGGNLEHLAGAAFSPFSGDTGSTTDKGAATISKAMTVTGFSVLCNGAPGAAKTSTYTFRVNGVNTSLAVTLSGATQRTGSVTGSVVVADMSMLDYGFTSTGSPTGMFCEINSVGNNSTAVAPITSKYFLKGGILSIVGGSLTLK